MHKKTFFIYCAYIWTKTLLGLTFTPYLSIKQTVRHPVLTPVIFTPFLGLIILLVMGKIASILITVVGLQRELVAIFLSATLLSILFWQLLLLYLLASFLVSSWKNK